MSYELHSEKGFICNLGSASRYNELINNTEFCSTNGKLCSFLKTGKTDEPREVIDEIEDMLNGTTRSFKFLISGKPLVLISLLEELRDGLKKANKSAEIVG